MFMYVCGWLSNNKDFQHKDAETKYYQLDLPNLAEQTGGGGELQL